MCGIAGAFEYGRTAGGLSEEILSRMGETIRHRGPDDGGVFLSEDRRLGFASRRLAIVDLAGGSQPMFGSDGTCLIFNGEIYNYPALKTSLRSDGVRFETNCDTEVILHLYRRHGDRCVDHLTGMFAFALWDPREGRVFFARDPIGEKPFYWTDHNGVFVFGSEIKAMLEHPAVSREVNEEAIGPYLAHCVTPAPETLYRGIQKLPPGFTGYCDSGGVKISQYASFAAPRRWSMSSVEEAAKQVRTLLEASVRARLMSDVPVGVLLSGGVDSSTIVALLSEQVPGLNSFTIGFPGHHDLDERDEARWLAGQFGTNHHEVEMTEGDAVTLMTDLIHHQDEPLADSTCLPHHAVCRLARDSGIKVLLAGEGADELFWGYDELRRTIQRWRMLCAVLALPRPLRRVAALATSQGRAPLRRERLDGIAAGRIPPEHMPLGLTAFQRERLLRTANASTGWAPGNANDEDPLTTYGFDTQEYEFGVRLPELLLMRADRFSMASSVEMRVPFLDPELVDYVYRLPIDLKVRDGISKFVLKQAVSDIVPGRVLKRPKRGFTPPVSSWFAARHGEVLRGLMGQDTLRRYFDVDYLAREVERADPASWESGHFLWPILNFGLWHKYWIEGEALTDLVDGPMGTAAPVS